MRSPARLTAARPRAKSRDVHRVADAMREGRQAAQVRDAIRVLFPEAVMLVREARQGLT